MNFSINRVIGSLAFYTAEGSSIKNAYTHLYRVLSGEFIPLIYFPELLQKILIFTPFPHLLFTPTFILINKNTPLDIPIFFATSLIWTVVLHFGSVALWKKSLKNYEGIGI
jgi:ABC-2 type transport system permease protein